MTGRRFLIALLLVLSLVVAAPLFAADIDLSLEADQTTITMQDTVNVSVHIRGDDARKAGRPVLPKSDAYQIVGQSSTLSSSIVGMSISIERIVTYAISPTRTGSIRIGPAVVKYKGRTYKSNTVELDVVTVSALAPQPNKLAASDRPVFIQAEVDNTQPYLGAPVTLSLYIYHRGQLTNLSSPLKPDFNNFWAEELLTPSRLSFSTVQVGDKQYQAALIARYALYPLESGEQTIDSFKLTAEVRASSGRRGRSPFSLFDDDFFGQRKRIDLESAPVFLKVKSLPAKGQPKDFEGTVGRFKMHMTLDKTKSAAGEPITLEAIVEGTGNFKTLKAPKIVLPDGVETFSQSSDMELQKTAERVSGKKIFSSIIIPRKQGELEIGPATLPYFDPADETYKVLTAAPIKINIRGKSKNADGNGVMPAMPREVTQTGKDIRYIRPDAKNLREIRSPFYESPVYFVVVAAWPLALLFGFVVRRYRRTLNGDRAVLRTKRAGRVSRTRLKKAAGMIGGDGGAFYAETTGAIFGFVADKTHTSAAGMTADDLRSVLRNGGADDDLVERLNELLREAETVRFGGVTRDEASRRAYLTEASDVLETISKLKLEKGGRS